jgi:hypothetical protein
MITVYRISSKLENYTCIIDLLGCVGHQKVENMINTLPWKPHVALWMALLNACRVHGNVEIGERIAKWILELAENAAHYVLLLSIYAAGGNRHLCENVE